MAKYTSGARWGNWPAMQEQAHLARCAPAAAVLRSCCWKGDMRPARACSPASFQRCLVTRHVGQVEAWLRLCLHIATAGSDLFQNMFGTHAYPRGPIKST